MSEDVWPHFDSASVQRESLNEQQKAGNWLAREIVERWPGRQKLAYAAAGSEVPTMPLLQKLWDKGQVVAPAQMQGEQLQWPK